MAFRSPVAYEHHYGSAAVEAYRPLRLNPPRIPGRPSVERGPRYGADSGPGPISSRLGLRGPAAGAVTPPRRASRADPPLAGEGNAGRFAVGSSTTASSVERRRLTSSRRRGG